MERGDFKRRGGDKQEDGERVTLHLSENSESPKGQRKTNYPVALFVIIFLVLMFLLFSIKKVSLGGATIKQSEKKIKLNLEPVISKLAIGILTSNKYHDRLRVAHEDWAKKWVNRGLVYYYSDREDDIPNLIKTGRCDDSYHGPNGLSCKTRFAFEHLQRVRPDANWYLRVMDDTYVFVENFARLVKDLDPEKPYLIGAKNCQRHAVGSFGKYFEPTAARAFFPDGGPGWILSKGFLKAVKWQVWDEIVAGVMPVDDCAFGVFAAAHGFDIIHYKGFSQEPGDYPVCRECPYLCNEIGEKWTKPWIPVTFHQHWHGTEGQPNQMKLLDTVLHLNFDFDDIDPYQEFPQMCGCNQTRWYFDRCKPFTEP